MIRKIFFCILFFCVFNEIQGAKSGSLAKGIVEIFTALIDSAAYSGVKSIMKKLKKGDDTGGMVLGIGKLFSKNIISGTDYPKATPSVTKTLLGDKTTFESFSLTRNNPAYGMGPNGWSSKISKGVDQQVGTSMKFLKTNEIDIQIVEGSATVTQSTGVTTTLDDIIMNIDSSVTSLGQYKRMSVYSIPDPPRGANHLVDTSTGFSYRGFEDSRYLTSYGPNGPSMRTGGILMSYLATGTTTIDSFGTKYTTIHIITQMATFAGMMSATVQDDQTNTQYDFVLAMQGIGLPSVAPIKDGYGSYIRDQRDSCDPVLVQIGYFCTDFLKPIEPQFPWDNDFTYCSKFCPKYRRPDGRYECVQCYQSTAACTLLLPLHYYSGNGCFKSDTGGYACGNACPQTCLQLPMWVCPALNAVMMTPYIRGVYCFQATISPGLEPSQCCISCPAGWYMSGCSSFILYDEDPDGGMIAYSISSLTNVIGPDPYSYPLTTSIKEVGMCYPCTTCVDGQYMVAPCTAVNNTVCETCSQTCPAGYYISSPCTIQHDRVCSPCSTDPCPDNTWLKSYCGMYSNKVCAPCTVCQSNQYVKTACFSFYDSTCEACTQCHPYATRLSACDLGHFWDSTICKCDIGYYGDGVNSCTLCKVCSLFATLSNPCPMGTSVDTQICNCNSGYYGDGVTCTPCDIGTFSHAGMTVCTTCPSGYYTGVNQNECTLCPTGKYSLPGNNLVCIPCSAGYYASSGGMSTCTGCGPGKYTALFSTALCSTCIPGTYSSGSANTACISCSAGSGQGPAPVISTIVLDAYKTSTPYGAYQQWIFGYEKNDIYNITFTMNTFYLRDHYVEVFSCPNARCSSSVKLRQYSNFVSQNPIVTVSQQYMKVYMYGMSYGIHDYWSASVTILSIAGWTACFDCSVGTYQTGIGYSTCVSCPPGQISLRTKATTCALCSAGYTNGFTGQSVCSICPPGTYSGTTGLSACIQCAAGTYTGTQVKIWGSITEQLLGRQSFGHILNIPYGTGSMQLNFGNFFLPQEYSSYMVLFTCNDLGCASKTFFGKYYTLGGVIWFCQLSICENTENLIYFTRTGLVNKMYPIIPSNTVYLIQRNDGSTTVSGIGMSYQGSTYGMWTSCTTCPTGTFQTQLGSTYCQTCDTICSLGYYTSTPCSATNNIICSACTVPTNYFLTTPGYCTTASCSFCGQGQFMTTPCTTLHDNLCQQCPVGYYQSSSHHLISSCIICPIGYYQNQNRSASCTICSEGSYSNATGSSVCSLCALGTYNTGQGLSYCSSCNPKNTTLALGSISCQTCPGGFYCPGSTGAIQCLAGTFCPTGYSSPIPCNAGFYCMNNQLAMVSWWCPPGSYCPLGSIFPTSCPAGTYSTSQQATGRDSCNDCGLGNYSIFAGFATCNVCDPGAYGDNTTGGLFCYPCDPGTYSPDYSSTACLNCPGGSYISSIGATGCIGCGMGRYYNLTGQTSPLYYPCPSGTFSNVTIASSCTFCYSGTYNPLLGQSSCQNCDICGKLGIFQYSPCSNPNNTICKNCTNKPIPSIWVSTVNVITTDSCPWYCNAGYYNNGGMNCTPCVPGSYQTGIGMLSASKCILCNAGTYSSGYGSTVITTCKICEPGGYQSGSGSNQCSLCPAGTYQTGYGFLSVASCTSCPTGSFQPNTGMTSLSDCGSCIRGTYQKSGETICTTCPEGNYNSGIGTTACQLCSNGTYSTGLGMTAITDCILCDLGRFSSHTGSTTCGYCNGNMYTDKTGMATCLPCGNCSIGMWDHLGCNTTHNVECVQCSIKPIGSFFSSPGITPLSDSCLWMCSAGYYQSETTCIACDVGTYQSGINMLDPSNCLPCQAGTYQTGTAITDPTRCVLCGPGLYQTGTGMTNCDLCTTGTYQTGYGMPWLSSCNLCESGTYQSFPGSTTNRDCIMCNIGTSGPIPGASSCIICAAGTYNSLQGASICPNCSAGTYSSAGNIFPQCIECYIGTYSSEGSTTCTACGLRTYNTQFGSATCQKKSDCGIGQYYVAESELPFMDSGCAFCYPIIGGAVFTTSGIPITSNNCLFSCGPGYLETQAWATYNQEPTTICMPCFPGNYQTGTSIKSAEGCTLCEAGTYLIIYAARSKDDCHLCYPGSYQDTQGADRCKMCDPGTYQTGFGIPTKDQCLPCNYGTYQPNYESINCLICYEGTYQPYLGASSCTPCAAGTFQTGNGMTSSNDCLSCPVGWYQASPESTSCDLCNPGSYQDYPRQPQCTLCRSGSYQTGYGMNSSDSCIPCGVGMYERGDGAIDSSACTPCDPGTYTPYEITLDCYPCLPGSYQNNSGSTYCDYCEPGTFSTGYAMDYGNCTQCDVGTYSHTGYGICPTCPTGMFSTGIASSTCQFCLVCGKGQVYTTPCTSSQNSTCKTCTIKPDIASFIFTTPNCDWQCPPGYYQNASDCIGCIPGTYQTGIGMNSSELCSSCPAGKFQSIHAANHPSNCTLCYAGTYSTMIASYTNQTCILCGPGTVSNKTGSNSSDVCIPCPLGFIPSPNHSICLPCSNGTYCPSGIDSPTLCEPKLICDGKSVASPLGYIHIVRRNCTGIISCPPGSNCSILQPDKGIMQGPVNTPHFAVTIGSNTSCNDMNWTKLENLREAIDFQSSHIILYWLSALSCSPGFILINQTCIPCQNGSYSSYYLSGCSFCPNGTFSSSIGSTSCTVCQPGTFMSDTGATSCTPCIPGQYQNKNASAYCINCPAGTFGNASQSPVCYPCEIGTTQVNTGQTFCTSCGAGQYNSPGDHNCSTCGNLESSIENPSLCPPIMLPDNLRMIWLSVRGAVSDECLAIGDSTFGNQTVGVDVFTNGSSSVCTQTLRVLGRPDISYSWVSQVNDFRRPITLNVIPFNDTFYTTLCASQGLGVLYTAQDIRGQTTIDLSGVSVQVIVQDQTTLQNLYQTTCLPLPSLSSQVIYGKCNIVSFCPATDISVSVVMNWPGGQSVSGKTMLKKGQNTPCPVTTDWLLSLEPDRPDTPYMTGDTVNINVKNLNPTGTLSIFKFAFKILSSASFVSFQSVYSVVTGTQNDIISIMGQISGTSGNILGLLKISILSSTPGLSSVIQIVPGSIEMTLSNMVSYKISGITNGFLCRTDGFLDLLLDTTRTTSLIVRQTRTSMIYWQALSPTGPVYPAQIYVISVQNVMNSLVSVTATCTSNSLFIQSTSCSSIKPQGSGYGDSSASVLVQYQGVSVTVNFTVFIPRNFTISSYSGDDDTYGRFKLFSDLTAGDTIIPQVDVTPYVPNTNNEQWTCPPSGIFSIATLSIQCGNTFIYNYRPPLWLFVFNGGYYGLGWYKFTLSHISPSTPFGIALVGGFDILPYATVTSMDPYRLTIQSNSLTLPHNGFTSRCTKVLLQNAGDPPTNVTIPVIQTTPKSLVISTSRSIIVSSLDLSGLVPSYTTISSATLLYSDRVSVDFLNDPRLTFASDSLILSGFTVMSTNQSGIAQINATITGIPCIYTSTTITVLGTSVQNSILICPSCTTLTRPDDPLNNQYPAIYPSSLPQTYFLVRKTLADNTYVDAFENISVSGNASLQNGYVTANAAGWAIVNSRSSPSPFTVKIVDRWISSANLLCNSGDCTLQTLTIPGDGASLSPFSYSTTLGFTISTSLVDGRQAYFPWLQGASVFSNGSIISTPSNVPLKPGPAQFLLTWGVNWKIPNSSTHIFVSKVQYLTLSGPNPVFQIYCSLIWEELSLSTKAFLTDGNQALINPVFSTTPPWVRHATALFHADWAGSGNITATFGTTYVGISIQATMSSRYILNIGLTFIPTQWTGPPGQSILIVPDITPSFATKPWYTIQNLSSRVVIWSSSHQDVIKISDDQTTATLMSDFYEPVVFTGTLMACDGTPVRNFTNNIAVNINPTTTGQIDIGQSTGIPVLPTPVSSIVEIPVYVYAKNPIISYSVEMFVPISALDPVDCLPGILKDSQCAVMQQGNQTYFRAIGSYLQSQSMGRVLLATIHARVRLNSVVTLSVSLSKAVISGTVIQNQETSFQIKIGTSTPPSRRLLQTHDRRLLDTEPVQTWGDVDGDGQCTSFDVQFMETYLVSIVFSGDRQICVVTCQWISQLTDWQKRQLAPISNPNSPPVTSDGSNVLFLLRSLVGKMHFFSSFSVDSTVNGINMIIHLVDYLGNLDPENSLVKITLITSENLDIIFNTSYSVNGSEVTVVCQRTPFGFIASTIPNTDTYYEPDVPVKITIQTFDHLGSSQDDRIFTFFPDKPFATFTIYSSTHSLPPVPPPPLLVVTQCTTMCDDDAFFRDFTIGIPSWIDDHTISTSYFLYPPEFSSLWPSIWKPSNPLIDSWVPVSTTINLSNTAQKTKGILVGTTFQIPFVPPNQMIMGIFSVSGMTLQRVYGGDFNRNCFFLQTPLKLPVILEFTMSRIFTGDITVTAIQLLNSEMKLFTTDTSPWKFPVIGLEKPVISFSTSILCPWVILWSLLGGVDDYCTISITPFTADGPKPVINMTCTSYPCVIVFLNQPVNLNIPTYEPVDPAIIIQRNTFPVYSRTSWRIFCSFKKSGKSIAHNVTITQRAIQMGLVKMTPSNHLSLSQDSIRALKDGIVILWINTSVVMINITVDSTIPESLVATIIPSVSFLSDPVTSTVTASLDQGPVVAGTKGYLMLRAIFKGGFTVRLDPSIDLIQIVSLNKQIYVNPSDLTVSISPDATLFTGNFMLIKYQTISLIVNGSIAPITPTQLVVCCSQFVTYSGSPIFGLKSYSSTFTVNNVIVYFQKNPSISIPPVDPRISVTFDTAVFLYNRSSGVWKVVDNARRSVGPTTIVFTYTQPVTLASIQISLLMYVIDAKALIVTFADSILQRIHCSSFFQHTSVSASIDIGMDQIDVSDQLTVISSAPSIADVTQDNYIVGNSPGISRITVFCRGFSQVKEITVVTDSIPFVSIFTHEYYLSGTKFSLFPLHLSGILQDYTTIPDISFMEPTVTLSSATSSYENHEFTLLQNSKDISDYVSFSIPSCLGIQPIYRTSIVVNIEPSLDKVDINIDGVLQKSLTLSISLAGANLMGFYAELYIDSIITSCTKGSDVTGIFLCNTNDPYASVIMTGSNTSISQNYTEIAIIKLSTPANSVYGLVEAYTTEYTLQNRIIAGQYGNTPSILAFQKHPILDSAVFTKNYQCLVLSSISCQWDTLPQLMYYGLILIHKLRFVESRIYSNDFELSIMMRVFDRFMNPDQGKSKILLFFNTSSLPMIPGATNTSGGMSIWTNYTQDGWYLCQWKQHIPVLNLSLSYTLITMDLLKQSSWDRIWNWYNTSSFQTGIQAPPCPHSAYYVGSILASYTLQGNGTINNTKEIQPDLACKLHIASRRLQISQISPGLLNVSIVLESFERLYETNMLILNPSTVSKMLAKYNFTPQRILKNNIQYTNDSSDPKKPCPSGYYFSSLAQYTPLPQHALPGPDCYDLVCMDGYQISDTQCIPTTVNLNIIWVCVLFALILGLAVALSILIIKLATWEKFYIVQQDIHMEMEEEMEVEEVTPRARRSSILANVIFDDYSQEILDGMFAEGENCHESDSDKSENNTQ